MYCPVELNDQFNLSFIFLPPVFVQWSVCQPPQGHCNPLFWTIFWFYFPSSLPQVLLSRTLIYTLLFGNFGNSFQDCRINFSNMARPIKSPLTKKVSSFSWVSAGGRPWSLFYPVILQRVKERILPSKKEICTVYMHANGQQGSKAYKFGSFFERLWSLGKLIFLDKLKWKEESTRYQERVQLYDMPEQTRSFRVT